MIIVQIGSNKGNTDNDPVWKLCQENLPNSLGWQLFLIEPNPKAFSRLCEAYSAFTSATFIEAAVTNTNGFITLFVDNHMKEGHEGSQHASLIPEHLDKMGHHRDKVSTIYVKSITFDSIVDLYDLKSIDYLQIDAEGYDAKIVYGIDFNKINIAKLEFEHCHIHPDTLKEVVKKLIDANFILNWKNKEDICYVKN